MSSESNRIKQGDTVPVFVQLEKADTGLFPQYTVIDSADSEEQAATNLVHVANGLYTPASKLSKSAATYIIIQYFVYTDSGHTTLSAKYPPSTTVIHKDDIEGKVDTVDTVVDDIKSTVDTNLDTTVSSRSSHDADDVDTTLTAAHGAGDWTTASSQAPLISNKIKGTVKTVKLIGTVKTIKLIGKIKVVKL